MFKKDPEIIQPEKGHLITTDTILLSNFIKIKKGDAVCELGCGSGLISILIGMEGKASRILGIEIQKELVETARKNIDLNRLQDSVEIIEGDIRDIKTITPPSIFDVVIANPPYIKKSMGRCSPDQRRSIARQETMGTLDKWIYAASYLLRSKGRAYFVFIPERLAEMIEELRKRRVEPKRLQFVHTHLERYAILFLLEGIKDGREGLSILPPRIIPAS